MAGYKYQIQSSMAVPRNARRIDFPIQGIDEFIISDLIPADAVWNDTPQIGVATYGDIAFANSPDPNNYADYVLRYIKSERLDGDFTRMFFGRNIPEAEANTPVRTASSFGDHPWPPILEQLKFVRDSSFPHSTNITDNGQSGFATAPRNYVREVYTPAANKGTRKLTEEFVGSSPFTIPRYPTPIASSVSYDLLGASGSFPECLHDDLVIKTSTTAEQIYFTAGGVSSAGAITGQFFPKTNFKTWAPYVDEDDQKYVDGLWYRKRVRVFPPPKPKTIVQ